MEWQKRDTFSFLLGVYDSPSICWLGCQSFWSKVVFDSNFFCKFLSWYWFPVILYQKVLKMYTFRAVCSFYCSLFRFQRVDVRQGCTRFLSRIYLPFSHSFAQSVGSYWRTVKVRNHRICWLVISSTISRQSSDLTISAGPSGTILGMFITGLFAASKYGWPMAFYFYGVLGLVWCVLMFFFGYDSPSEHPSISKAEKFYIENSLGHTKEKIVRRYSVFVVNLKNENFRNTQLPGKQY